MYLLKPPSTRLSTVLSALAYGALLRPVQVVAVTNSSRSLSAAAQSLFDYSMQVQDSRWDDYYKYILFPETGGEMSTRFTAWYTAGLLHRNQGNDVENAKAAIENILRSQMTSEYDSAWYGTYKLTLDGPEPTSNSSYWPPEIYTTYDPNWREFVGTQLIQVVELFSDLLGDDLVGRIEDSLERAAVGAMRRNGSYPAGDNLVPAYSNPALMRCLTVGWVGARRARPALARFADEQARLLVALFRAGGADTLGEYNAPTYYGMDVWALAAHAAYGPPGAVLTAAAGGVLAALWRDVAAHYNPYLRNLAGPYDRAYTRDMTMHSAVLSLWWWGLFGRDRGGQPPLGEADLRYDASQGAALALVMATAARHVPGGAAGAALAAVPGRRWPGARLLRRTVHSSLPGGDDDDDAAAPPRVATSWVSAELMVGGVSLAEPAGGRDAQFVPAIAHWASDPARRPAPYVGFFSLYPTASTIDAVAGERSLRVRYPDPTQAGTDIFTFAVSGIPPGWVLDGNVVTGLEELPCLRVNVSAPGLARLPVTASTSTLEDHFYYNVSYVVPSGFEGVPSISLDMQYTC